MKFNLTYLTDDARELIADLIAASTAPEGYDPADLVKLAELFRSPLVAFSVAILNDAVDIG